MFEFWWCHVKYSYIFQQRKTNNPPKDSTTKNPQETSKAPALTNYVVNVFSRPKNIAEANGSFADTFNIYETDLGVFPAVNKEMQTAPSASAA